ncbi:unnamed protein product [Danaus chrysippus]|uniref:(African queen) hypothetical protein n=1 Tax=Danaus chrysippus TaxID=151541 RepID=A0A8J2WAP5_9NEOP|nr:unnamed protein product [Danaus chrysippus]
MNQRSKHLVLLALSKQNQNSIEVQNLTNSTKLPYSQTGNALSLTNSECPVSPSNLEDPTTTTPEQGDTTFNKPGNSPSILFATNKSHEQEGIDFQTGDYSGTDSGDEYRPGPRSRSSSSSSSSNNSTNSSSTSICSSDSPVENNNCNNESNIVQGYICITNKWNR